jgi:hypothetical protein
LQHQCTRGSRPFSAPQQTGAPPRIFTTQPSGSNRFWLRLCKRPTTGAETSGASYAQGREGRGAANEERPSYDGPTAERATSGTLATLVYLTAGESYLGGAGAGLADGFSALSPDRKRRRPALLHTRCRSYMAHVCCSLGYRRRRALFLSLYYSISQQTWPDNKAEQAAVGGSITPSEVKRRRVEWFVICQPLPGSCWVAEASKQRSSHANRPSVTCFAHVPCPSEAVMSLLSQQTVRLRTAVDVPPPPPHCHSATLQHLCDAAELVPRGFGGT